MGPIGVKSCSVFQGVTHWWGGVCLCVCACSCVCVCVEVCVLPGGCCYALGIVFLG